MPADDYGIIELTEEHWIVAQIVATTSSATTAWQILGTTQDLSRLDDVELALHERLSRKLAGEDVGEIVPPAFRIEFVSTRKQARAGLGSSAGTVTEVAKEVADVGDGGEKSKSGDQVNLGRFDAVAAKQASSVI